MLKNIETKVFVVVVLLQGSGAHTKIQTEAFGENHSPVAFLTHGPVLLLHCGVYIANSQSRRRARSDEAHQLSRTSAMQLLQDHPFFAAELRIRF